MSGETRASDLELANRLKRGDLSAFDEVYRHHGTKIYNLAFRMLGDAADAEDAMQEAFLQAFRKIGGFKGESSLGTWLYRLAMNLTLDRIRSRSSRNDRLTDPLDAPAAEQPSVSDPGVELVVSRLDLERAIARLPEGYRAVFLLHDVEGFDHKEVGTILGISEGTSKSQVHKARLKLRRLLAPASPSFGQAAS
jgi:RNA polymerase sigma-70 factor (ECF subfamily)